MVLSDYRCKRVGEGGHLGDKMIAREQPECATVLYWHDAYRWMDGWMDGWRHVAYAMGNVNRR